MKIAFVFPGQGSQSVGMMQSFEALPGIKETFSEAADATGEDFWKLVHSGPEQQLNLTINTQPVMLIAGVALYRAWREMGGEQPAIAAGHSLGEYSALVAGGAIGFRDAVMLVRFRAQAMQEAAPAGAGAMAAVLGLEDDAVRAICIEASTSAELVEAANFNSPAQVVIAGHRVAVDRAIEIAKVKGAKRAIVLPMSVPSHCGMMRPAAERMRQRLASVSVSTSRIPVLHNADVTSAESGPAIRDALVRQLFQPVRWVETVRAIIGEGATHMVECGPGRVLAGLHKRIAPEIPMYTFGDEAAFQLALTALKQGENGCSTEK